MSARRITFLNRFYWPAGAASGQMLTELAEDLAADGWEVTVIAGRNHRGPDGEGMAREERRNGVRILRVGTSAFGAGGLRGRFLEYLSFHVSSFVKLLSLPDRGVVTSLSDPPLLLLPVFAGRIFRRYKVAYWVQDIYPELLAALGVSSRSSLHYRLLSALARRLNSSCDAVITLGDGMKRAIIAAGARPERTAVVHNWADTDRIFPVPDGENPFLAEHDLCGKFVVLYSGNAGRAHEFGTLEAAMLQLRNDDSIVFLFIGDGKKMPELKSFAAANQLANARFLPFQPLDRLAHSLSAADVSIVTELPAASGLLVPSKTYGALASGRPVAFIGSSGSDVAEVVRDSGSGTVLAPGDSAGLVAFLRELRDNPDAAARMGALARRAAENLYSRKRATKRWAAVLNSLAGAPAAAL